MLYLFVTYFFFHLISDKKLHKAIITNPVLVDGLIIYKDIISFIYNDLKCMQEKM